MPEKPATKHHDRPQNKPLTDAVMGDIEHRMRSTVKLKSKRQEQLHRAGVGVRETSPTSGTPQTKAKLRPDTLVTMFKRGSLTSDHLLAAAEIRDVFEALTRPMWPRIVDYEPRIGSPVKRGYVQPIDRMSSKMWILWQSHYKPWANEMSKAAVSTPAGHARLLEVTISVVVDGESLSTLSALWRLPRRSGGRLFGSVLRDGLGRYCEIGAIG